jgi:hypothetical protein
VAAFRIAGEQTRSRERSAKRHLAVLLQRAAAIPSPKAGFLGFAQAHDASSELANTIRESIMATHDFSVIDVAHRTLICLGSITNARKLLTPTQNGCVDKDGGKATAALEAALTELRKLTVPT